MLVHNTYEHIFHIIITIKMHVYHDNQINDHYFPEELIDEGVILVNLLHYSATKYFPRRHITYAILLQCNVAIDVLVQY